MINVLISDADLFAREGIKQMLANEEAIRVSWEASTMFEVFEALRTSQPDVCILGIFTGHDGLQFVRETRRQGYQTPLLIMGHCHERDFALRAVRASAAGYLAKDCTGEQLADAIRSAAKRQPYVSDTVCELLVESITEGRANRQHDKLSDRDFEILCLLADGVPLAKIASMCDLSVSIVRARKNRIMERMCLRTDAQLVKYALKNRLIEHV